MSCGCDNRCSGNGLNGLMGDLLPYGSTFRAGFHLNYFVYARSIDYARELIEDCLWGSGIFSELSVSISTGLTELYLLVSGRTNYDFANKDDVAGAIQDAIQWCDTGVTIKGRDPVAVDSIPQEFANQQGVAQPGKDYRGDNDDPEKCNWNKLSFSDYIACEFGIKPSTATVVGIGFGFLIVMAISRGRK